jgi:hypothetical protein
MGDDRVVVRTDQVMQLRLGTAPLALSGSGPLASAEELQAGAVDDNLDQTFTWLSIVADINRLPPACLRLVIRYGETALQNLHERIQEAFSSLHWRTLHCINRRCRLGDQD